MSDGFVGGDGAAGPVQGAWLAGDGTGGAAVGAGKLLAEGLGLLFQERGQGSFGQPVGGGLGDLFHGVEVGVESGSVVAEGASCDDFAPVLGEVTDFLEEFGGSSRRAMVSTTLYLRPRGKSNSLALYRTLHFLKKP
jgi:hypothetical protein